MRPRDSRFIRFILIAFFLLAIGYALYEAQGFLYGPSITVEEMRTTREAFTTVTGRAERISELRLNGKTISVTEGGEFAEPYVLAEGTNRLILEARDARGRTAKKAVDIVYIPSESTPRPRPPATSTPMTSSTTTATSSEGLE